MATIEELKAATKEKIRDKVAKGSILKTEVADQLDASLDFIEQEAGKRALAETGKRLMTDAEATKLEELVKPVFTIVNQENYTISDFSPEEKVNGFYKVWILNITGTLTFPQPVNKWYNIGGNTFNNSFVNTFRADWIHDHVEYTISKTPKPDIVAPVLNNYSTNTEGTLITLTFNEPIGEENITFSRAGTKAKVGATVTLAPTIAIIASDVITFSGTVEDMNDNVLTIPETTVLNNVSEYLAFDNFNDANTTSIVGRSTPIGNKAYTKTTASTANLGITNNMLYLASAGSAQFFLPFASATNIEITVKIITPGVVGDARTLFNVDNAGKFIDVDIMSGQIVQRTPTTAVLTTGQAVLAVANDVIKITRSGSTISYYRNGNLMHQATLTLPASLTATNHGIQMNGTTIRLKDLGFK